MLRDTTIPTRTLDAFARSETYAPEPHVSLAELMRLIDECRRRMEEQMRAGADGKGRV